MPRDGLWGMSLVLMSLVLMSLLSTVDSVQAQSLYVTDRLVVSLREQPQAGAGVKTFLKSDQPVEWLEDQGDYALVRTESGESGYVQSQYLTQTVPKARLISQLETRNQQLLEQIKVLETAQQDPDDADKDALQKTTRQLQSARQELADLTRALQRSEAALNKVTTDYQQLQENSGKVVEIVKERERLQQVGQTLQTRVTELEDERDALLKRGAIKWFFAGAGVLVLGWLIGKASSSRRRSSF